MSFEDRQYQKQLSYAVRKALATHRKVIMCSVMGSGKTKIASDFVERACNKDITCVFLSDRVEILEQTAKTFTAHKIDYSIVDASVKVIHKHQVYLGMVETFHRRFSAGKFRDINIGLVILDECHVGNYTKVVEMLDKAEKPPYIIGLTATPISSSTKKPLNKTFQNIVCGPSVKWLVDNKYICPSIDIGQKQLYEFEKKNGEFTAESQFRMFGAKKSDITMFNIWKKHASDRQTICYNINLEHNEKVKEMFIANGVSCESVDGETDTEERRQTIERFRNCEIQVLCNVGIATKGFDAPCASCIIENFATDSLAKHIQVVGRGDRMMPGKDNFITIDMGNNILRHGSFNDEIDWEHLFVNDNRRVNEKQKNKYLCPVCFAYLDNKFISECHVCGEIITEKSIIKFEFSIPEELKTKPISEMSIEELKLYSKWKGFKPGWLFFQLQSRGVIRGR
jgi:superfamily II DNA or RNA helicase